jgi:hypothetical protein
LQPPCVPARHDAARLRASAERLVQPCADACCSARLLQSVHSASGSGSEHEDGGKSSTAIQPLRSPPASSRSGSAKSGSVSGSEYSEYSEYGSGSGSGSSYASGYSGSTRSSAGLRRMQLVISSKNELRYRQHFIRRHVPLTCGFATPLPAPSLYSRPRCHARRRLGWVTIADIHFVLGSETARPFRAPRGQLRAQASPGLAPGV